MIKFLTIINISEMVFIECVTPWVANLDDGTRSVNGTMTFRQVATHYKEYKQVVTSEIKGPSGAMEEYTGYSTTCEPFQISPEHRSFYVLMHKGFGVRGGFFCERVQFYPSLDFAKAHWADDWWSSLSYCEQVELYHDDRLCARSNWYLQQYIENPEVKNEFIPAFSKDSLFTCITSPKQSSVTGENLLFATKYAEGSEIWRKYTASNLRKDIKRLQEDMQALEKQLKSKAEELIAVDKKLTLIFSNV